jgi:uncharacterized cupredoxin-like copper-binding protein
MRWLFLVLTIMSVSLAFVACGDDDDDGKSTVTPTGGANETTIDVELRDYSINIAPRSAPAGSVTFQVTNTGPSVHEFVLARTDLPAADLPTDSDGAVTEETGDIEVIDEAEDVEVDGEASFTVDLDAGHYVYFCNIVEEEDGQTIAHYANGMHGELTVD